MKKLVLSLVVISISINLLNAQTTCLEEGIYFTTQAQIDDFATDYPDCSKILGNVYISGEMTNLNGLNSIEVIVGYLSIAGTDNLHNLDGLESLDSIGTIPNDYGYSGGLTIGAQGGVDWGDPNYSLSNIDGLIGLYYVGGGLSIEYNPLLENLDGLDNLTLIGGGLRIRKGYTEYGPYTSILENIEGLSNLTSINGTIRIENLDSLTSLQGLENIDPAGISGVNISANNNLSYCEVASICSYLELNSDVGNINNNALGCNSEEEVLLACNPLGVSEIKQIKPFSIYPNPVSKDLYITSDQTPSRYKIYNQIGQVLIEGNEVQSPINISTLEVGNYILELSFKDKVYREKIIVY